MNNLTIQSLRKVCEGREGHVVLLNSPYCRRYWSERAL